MTRRPFCESEAAHALRMQRSKTLTASLANDCKIGWRYNAAEPLDWRDVVAIADPDRIVADSNSYLTENGLNRAMYCNTFDSHRSVLERIADTAQWLSQTEPDVHVTATAALCGSAFTNANSGHELCELIDFVAWHRAQTTPINTIVGLWPPSKPFLLAQRLLQNGARGRPLTFVMLKTNLVYHFDTLHVPHKEYYNINKHPDIWREILASLRPPTVPRPLPPKPQNVLLIKTHLNQAMIKSNMFQCRNLLNALPPTWIFLQPEQMPLNDVLFYVHRAPDVRYRWPLR